MKWSLPLDIYKSTRALSIALQWYGALTNDQNIVSKRIKASEATNTDSAAVAMGDIQFFTPKSAGIFVFRLYDAGSDESALYTLNTSGYFILYLSAHT